MKTLLLQSFHTNNTIALARDFIDLGYKVIMPLGKWNQIGYGGDNSLIAANFKEGQIEQLTFEQYMELPPGDAMIGCFEQQDDIARVAQEHGDRILGHAAGNDVPFHHGLINWLFSPDIITYENYPAKHKMLYLFPPVVPDLEKDHEQSFGDKKIYSYNHFYEKYWRQGWAAYQEFIPKFGKHVPNFGHESPDGLIPEKEVAQKMSESFFTLYFKDRDCYGQSVTESMALGTPVIALRQLIHGKTLGSLFLDDSTAILGWDVNEIIEKLNKLTFSEYVNMSLNAQARVSERTENAGRLTAMRSLLELTD